MAELITLPSLAMSPMAFSLMASDLHWASRAWLRAATSFSGTPEIALARSEPLKGEQG
jgi:hypothetical protein